MSEGPVTAPDVEALGELTRSGSFEEAMLGLEQVVSRLEEGQLSIAAAVTWYELGLTLSQRCTNLLKQAELQIRVLEAKYDFDQMEDPDDIDANE